MPVLEAYTPEPGSLRLIEADPVIEEHEDAIYMPVTTWQLDDDPRWGLYDSSRRLIRGAAYCRGPSRSLVGQGEAVDVDDRDIEDAPDTHFVYAGPLHLHYGHFLLATLSRLWPFLDGDRSGLRLLWHSGVDPVVAPGFPFIGQCLGALGLAGSQFRRFTRPTRIKRLTVVAPAFEEEHLGHRAFQRLCRTIGNCLAPGADPSPCAPAYLSRTALTWGVKAIANEHLVCEALSNLGVEVVHPEQLAMADQIRLFAWDRVVMGLAGSAFHTALFSPPRSRLISIDFAAQGSQLLVNRLNGIDMVHVRPTAEPPSEPGTGAITTIYTLPDPLGAARDLLHAAQSHGGG